MSTRKVTVKVTTQKDTIVFESSARTFGELKAEQPGIKWDNMRVVERSTKNTLQVDEAILPATDFLLFVVPEKVKAGADFNAETATYNELRSHISQLNKLHNAGLSLDGKIDELRSRVQGYYNGSTTDNAAAADIISAIESHRAKINESVDALIEIIGNQGSTPIDNAEYVIKLTADDLESEAQQIKAMFKL